MYLYQLAHLYLIVDFSNIEKVRDANPTRFLLFLRQAVYKSSSGLLASKRVLYLSPENRLMRELVCHQ
jgi:hypothetical protein